MLDAGYTLTVGGWLEDELLRWALPAECHAPEHARRRPAGPGPSERPYSGLQRTLGSRHPVQRQHTAGHEFRRGGRTNWPVDAGLLSDPDDFEGDRGSLMATRPQLELRESSRAHGSPRCSCSNPRALRRRFPRIRPPASSRRSLAGTRKRLGHITTTATPRPPRTRHDEPCRSETRRSSRDADGWTDDNALTQRYDTYKVSMPSPMRLRARVIQAARKPAYRPCSA